MHFNNTADYESASNATDGVMTTTQDGTSHGGKGLQSIIFGNFFVAAMTLLALYVVVSLIVYHLRSKSKITFIFVLHMFTGFATLCSLISEQLELQLGNKADIYCFFYTLLTSSFYFLGILSAFTLLWFRQRSLYSTSILRAYNGSCWRFLSKYVIVGIYFVFLPASVLVSVNIKLISTKSGGCILQVDDEDTDVVDLSIVIAILVAFGVFFQIFLLALFVYPLRKTKLKSSNNQTNLTWSRRCPFNFFANCCSKNKKVLSPGHIDQSNSANIVATNVEDSSSFKHYNRVNEQKLQNHITSNHLKSPTFSATQNFSQSAENMEKSSAVMIRRLLICTAVCISSELLSGGIATICLTIAPDSYWSLVVHADLLTNLLAVTFSFVNWKERIFPFGKIKPNPPRRNKRLRISDPFTTTSVVSGSK